jgi:hypothetical protein
MMKDNAKLSLIVQLLSVVSISSKLSLSSIAALIEKDPISIGDELTSDVFLSEIKDRFSSKFEQIAFTLLIFVWLIRRSDFLFFRKFIKCLELK